MPPGCTSDRIAALRERGQRTHDLGQPDVSHRSVPVAESPAGQSDLAQQRRQRHAHPHRLLPVLGPLHGPTDRDQGSALRHPVSQVPDGSCRYRRDRLGPLRRLRTSVGLAGDVVREPLAIRWCSGRGSRCRRGSRSARRRPGRASRRCRCRAGSRARSGDLGREVVAQRAEELEAQPPSAPASARDGTSVCRVTRPGPPTRSSGSSRRTRRRGRCVRGCRPRWSPGTGRRCTR